MLSEIVKGDDLQAAFKNHRCNNYKKGLYQSLGSYEDPASLALVQNLNTVIQHLYRKEKPESKYDGDKRFAAVCDLAVQLMPLEKGQLASI